MERQLVASLRNTLEISAFRLKLEAQKRTVGIGNALLYHQALIDFNSDSTLVVERERIIRDIQIQINRIINDRPGAPVLPAIEIIELGGVAGMDELLQKISGMNTQLERVQLEEMIAESNIRIERAARYPQISVFGNYSYTGQTNEVGFVESSTVYGAQYGIRVRFNLYDGGRLRTRLHNASLQQEIATVSVRDTRSVIESHLAGLLNAYEAYVSQLRLIDSSIDAAQKTMVIAQEQLQEGVISGFDFRQTQLTALRVENQRVGILYALKSIETDILRLSGELAQQYL
jgi:outer membrane protein TolC